MNSRLSTHLLPIALMTTVLLATVAQAQTPPTITCTQTGGGTTTLLGAQADYRNYTFNITGFSGVGPDPSNAYTIFSLSNVSIESSPNFYGLAPFSLPAGWTFTDTSDFIVSTDAVGIHAFDPTFGLTVFQKAGTAAIDPNNAPFTLYHQVNGVDPFLSADGSPLIIRANAAVPEASSLISFGLLLAGGLGWSARRSRRQGV